MNDMNIEICIKETTVFNVSFLGGFGLPACSASLDVLDSRAFAHLPKQTGESECAVRLHIAHGKLAAQDGACRAEMAKDDPHHFVGQAPLQLVVRTAHKREGLRSAQCPERPVGDSGRHWFLANQAHCLDVPEPARLVNRPFDGLGQGHFPFGPAERIVPILLNQEFVNLDDLYGGSERKGEKRKLLLGLRHANGELVLQDFWREDKLARLT